VGDVVRDASYQMIIMRNEDRIWGRPKMTDVITGQNSEKLPAGSRYEMTCARIALASFNGKSLAASKRTFFKLSNTTRPYWTATTTDENESSNTISAASMAMSDPLPIEMPTSAAFREGASLTPSPVMATTLCFWYSRTMRSFCSGVVLANTTSSYSVRRVHW
jgi:hypothetical protein